MNILKSASIKSVIIGSFIVLGGCSQDVSDLQAFIAQTKSAHVGSVKPIPSFKPYESFSYSATELRDPFESTKNLDIKYVNYDEISNHILKKKPKDNKPLI